MLVREEILRKGGLDGGKPWGFQLLCRRGGISGNVVLEVPVGPNDESFTDLRDV